MADFDLLVLGDCNGDVVLRGDSVEPVFGQSERLVEHGSLTIGGSGAITACGAARLGLRTALVAVVGDDPLGRLMLDAVGRGGVDVSRCTLRTDRSTGVTVVLSRGGDRAILTVPGTVADLRPDAIDIELVRASRHVHVSSYYLQVELGRGLPTLFGDARAAGATTSVDPNWDPQGVDGISRVAGLTTHHEIEAHTNRVMIERARHVVVVTDASKIGHVAFARICEIERVHEIITDTGADLEAVAAFTDAGVRVTAV